VVNPPHVFDRPVLRLLHYWWPIALGWSMTIVAGRATGRAVNPVGMVALLAGILAAYSFDRIFDASASSTPPWVNRALLVVGTAAAAVCGGASCLLPLRTATLVPLLGTSALLYPRLKQQAVTKLVALPLVWTWASFALPFDDGSWLGWRWVFVPASIPLTLLVAAGCVLCDLKDEERDRRAGVRSLPAIAGRSITLRAAIALAAAAGALAMAEHRTAVALTAAVLGLSTLTPEVLAVDNTGPLVVDVILTLPGILISTRLV
jgi:4-hydroxybenzoate polyprenyltransferase